MLTYSRRIDRRPRQQISSTYAAHTITHDTYGFPHRLPRVCLLRQPLRLQPSREVPSVAEEKRPSIQMRLDQRKQVRFHRMRRILNGNIRVKWHDLELGCVPDVVQGYSSIPLAVGDKNEVLRWWFIWGKSEAGHTENTRFGEHAHMVREIKPTIPWIALPNRIAPFGGGVPGAKCDS